MTVPQVLYQAVSPARRRAYRVWHPLVMMIAFSLFVSGCTHTHMVNLDEEEHRWRKSDLDNLNDDLRDRTADITAKDGRNISAEGIIVRRDSAEFKDPASGLRHSIPTAEIMAIEYRHHGIGAVHGAIFGVLGGGIAVAGAVYVLAGRPHQAEDASIAVGVGAALGGVGGGLIGVTYGAIAGSKQRYEFEGVFHGDVRLRR